MFVRPIADTCRSCGEILPRAAVNRCPFCRAAILRQSGIGSVTCRRCRGAIPRAHAGQCPHCADRLGVGEPGQWSGLPD